MSAYDELVGRLERTRPVHNGLGQPIAGLVEHRNPDGPEAAAAIRALEGENFTLAAGQCLFDDGTGLTGDEGGTPYCAMKAARQSAEAKLEAVKEALAWARAEINGQARYTTPEQRQACIDRLDEALSEDAPVTSNAEAAYGAMWSCTTADPAIHARRKHLLSMIGGQGSDGQRRAVAWAVKNMPETTDDEIARLP